MGVVLSSTGSELQSVVPETAKLRGPCMRTVRVRGTARFPCAADRRRWEPRPAAWWDHISKFWSSSTM